MNHTSIIGEAPENKCDCEIKSAIPFLDTLCSIKNGKIDTDLYKKPTDRNQYLLPSSCHSKSMSEELSTSWLTPAGSKQAWVAVTVNQGQEN